MMMPARVGVRGMAGFWSDLFNLPATIFNFPGTLAQVAFPSLLPDMPAAIVEPAPAPQTEAKMTTWTPADIWEAQQQRGVEREIITGSQKPYIPGVTIPGGVTRPPVPPSPAETPWGTYILLGFGVFAIAMMGGGRR